MKKILSLLLILINIPLGIIINLYNSKKNFFYMLILGVGITLMIPSIPIHYGDSIRYFRLYELFSGNFSRDIGLLNRLYGDKVHSILYMIIILFKKYNIDYIMIPTTIFFFIFYQRYYIFNKINSKNKKTLYFLSYFSFPLIIFVSRFGIGMTILILGIYRTLYFKENKKGILMIVVGSLFHESLLVILTMFLLSKYLKISKRVKYILIISSFGTFPILSIIILKLSNKHYIFYKLNSYIQRSGFFTGMLHDKYSLLFFLLNKIIIIVITIIYLKSIKKIKQDRLSNFNFLLIMMSIMFFYSSVIGNRLIMMSTYSFIIYCYIHRERIFSKKISETMFLALIYTPGCIRNIIYFYGLIFTGLLHYQRLPSYFYQPAIVQIINYDYNNQGILKNYTLERRMLSGEEKGIIKKIE